MCPIASGEFRDGFNYLVGLLVGVALLPNGLELVWLGGEDERTFVGRAVWHMLGEGAVLGGLGLDDEGVAAIG